MQMRMMQTETPPISLELLLSNLPGMVYRCRNDSSWTMEFVSAGSSELTGYQADDLIGNRTCSYGDLIHPDDRERVWDEVQQCLAQHRTVQVTYRIITAAAQLKWVCEQAKAILDERGELLALEGFISDVSPIKKAEEETLRQLSAQGKIIELLKAIGAPGLNLPSVMELVSEHAQAMTGASGAAVELFDQDTIIYCAASGSAVEQIGMRLSLAHSLSGIAFRQGKQIYCEDTETDARVDKDACARSRARSMVVTPLRTGDKIIGVLKVLSDRVHAFGARDCSNLQIVVESLGAVIQRHAALEQLMASEAQYRLLFNNNPQPMWVHDASSLRILAVNRAAVRKYGYSEQEFLDMSMYALYESDDPRTVEESLSKAQRSSPAPALARHRKKDGSAIDAELSSDAIVFKQVPAVLTLASDVTPRLLAERSLAQASEKLHDLAYYDPLTKLPNRLLLLDRLQEALASGSGEKTTGALMYVDLDNFRAINDTFGHDAGDMLVLQTADRLKACVGAGATIARLAADEFAVMLDKLHTHPAHAKSLAESVAARVLAAIGKPYCIVEHDYYSTACIGITLFGDSEDKATELLKRTHLAMLDAKEAGRNTFRFFDQSMQSAAITRSVLEAQMRLALEENQFHLYYQPQLDWNGRVTGAEALVRWHHPQRGTVLPSEFIGLAENTGSILQLGDTILRQACAQLAAWSSSPDTAHLSLAVNISARQFRHPSFVQQLKDVLAYSAADPRKLRLELTESMLVDDIEDTIAKMNALKEHGVRFSLDDFGTGYSSLLYLKRMPLEYLKIDRSFVRDILTDPNDAVIVRAIISLGRNLNLGIIAEGVEMEAQRDYLEQCGCGLYQGYLFSRPLPLDEFQAYLLERKRNQA